ncbi:MAG: hypothetical protein Q8K18_04790 [Burkholderiales bacterium]|nr:hypothetical protein [Burkholderiales bacterium]
MKPMMKAMISFAVSLLLVGPGTAFAASQDKFDLPGPYLGWESSYLKQFPGVQKVMDHMIETTVRQIKEPEQDILHNRICSALAYKMAVDTKLPKRDQMLAVVTDILHNIDKEEKSAALTDPKVFGEVAAMVARLRKAGHFKASPGFWSDEAVLKNPKVGGNRALVHHLTGALTTGATMKAIGGFSPQDIARVQVAIVGHSTGYWYFRQSVDDAIARQDAWKVVFPEPEGAIAQFAHDADLISQFVPESVVPEGSKWRVLAAKRWGAKGPVEEAHVVYYVFFRLFEEAKTKPGKAMALEKWREIRPELVKLMKLKTDDDPVKVLGIPKVFQRS